MTRLLADILACATILLTRLLTAVQAQWVGCGPSPKQRIYFANHASHGDFVLIWTVLPSALRQKTRPVAAADYWLEGRLRAFFATRVYRSVLIDRTRPHANGGPLSAMTKALRRGASLIVFPEGTRNTTDNQLLPFKSGLYHLARRQPDIELVPVWIANLNRSLPKGEVVPVPLLCSVRFGVPLKLKPKESKVSFLMRAQAALLSLAPRATQGIRSDR